ncbi:MAG: NADH-quinone oxidoreductase subunit J [Candidatus Lindowbacteria bacterium]|nr:NADH-quinone oxidoreductase subunit J [Candidatus Lindowbacteria bacterium]
MATILFAFFAVLTIGFAVVVVFAKEVFQAVFALLGTLCEVAGLLAVTGATTVAALQILIYAGGVFVLFLFAVLVTDKPKGNVFRTSQLATAFAGVLASGIGLVIFSVVVSMDAAAPLVASAGTAQAIGRSFLGSNLLTFEAVSVLLLVSLVAAVIVIRKELSS